MYFHERHKRYRWKLSSSNCTFMTKYLLKTRVQIKPLSIFSKAILQLFFQNRLFLPPKTTSTPRRKEALFACAFSVFALFLLLFVNNLEANHGPGTGGGATTIPALTLKSGAFSVGLRTELTEFESISNSKLLRKAEEAGAFDVLDRTFLHTVDMGYGITDDLTIGLGIGWFEAINFREGEFEDDEVEVFQANPDGITDVWLSGKYRFWRGPHGHYAILAGVKFPTGVDDKENSGGEKIEAVEQPGSGSYDFSTGFAYSRWLTEKWTLDTNIQYTYRTEGARDFEIGDRMDWNLATAYQVIQRNKYPNFSPVGEINVRYLFRD